MPEASWQKLPEEDHVRRCLCVHVATPQERRTGNSVNCTLSLSIIRTALLTAFEIAEVKNKRRYASTALVRLNGVKVAGSFYDEVPVEHAYVAELMKQVACGLSTSVLK